MTSSHPTTPRLGPGAVSLSIPGVCPSKQAAQLAVSFTRSYWNEYLGTADELVAAGLVRRDMLPGQPSRGTTQCSFELDGQPAKMGGRARNRADAPPRLAIIRRVRGGATFFEVRWPITQAELSRRHEAWCAAERERDAEWLKAKRQQREAEHPNGVLQMLAADETRQLIERVMRRAA